MQRVMTGILAAVQIAAAAFLLDLTDVMAWKAGVAIVLGAGLVWALTAPGRRLERVLTWQMAFLEALVVLTPLTWLATGLLARALGGTAGPAGMAWVEGACFAALLLAAGVLAFLLVRWVPAQVMARVQMGVGLWLEVGLMAVLAIALIYGGLEQGPFFWIYIFGILTALAAAVTWVAPARHMGKLVTHGALLMGCVVFAFPFLWQISTSFKYDEKMFVYPPQWLPSLPPEVHRSPYVNATEMYQDVRKPPGLEDRQWRRLWPKMQEALWLKGSKLLPAKLAGTVEGGSLGEALAHGLWSAASPGVSEDVWQPDKGEQGDAAMIRAVCNRVDQDRVNEVWNTIDRYVALRDPRVKDVDLNEYALGPRPAATATSAPQSRKPPSYLDLWRPREKCVRCVVQQVEAGASGQAPLVIDYDFRDADRASVSADLPLPIRGQDLLSVSVPLHQDRSWHRLRFELEIDGKRYATEDPLYLGTYRWQELTLKFKDKDPTDERDQGIWPLVRTAESGAYNQPGKFRLTMILDRASRLGAVWSKFTDSYRRAYIATEHRWNYLFNSVYLVVLNVLGQILSCSLVAYAFARLKWPGRDVLFAVMLATMMLPPQVTMILVFLIFKTLHWYNTLKALWVPSFLGGAFFIFMLRQFMKTIPVELEDAAKIDGCGFFGVYWRIILPLMKPALAAVAIFTFMGTWNNFMGPLIYINDQRLYPLALGLFDFRSEHGGEYGMLMAASTLMTIPVVAIFFLAQKYFIQGVTLTGIKG